MSWFAKLFKGADTVAKDICDHIEAEFKVLEARVVALEGGAGAKPVASPVKIPASTLPNPKSTEE